MMTRGTWSSFFFAFANLVFAILVLAILISVILAVSGTAAAQGNGMAMASAAPNDSKGGQTRTYYIAADEVTWDYVPGGMDHTPHWHRNTVVVNQMRTDVTSMAPMQMVTADMVPDDPGIWLVHCHIAFHNAQGMAARYSVTP